jgi:protein TonB
MNRPFTLPVVIACSAHAFLMFGFKTPDRPPIVPVVPAPTNWDPVTLEPPPPEKPEIMNIRSEPSGGKPAAPRPMTEDRAADKISPSDFVMEIARNTPTRVKVVTRIISPGEGPIDGDPNALEYGPGRSNGKIIYSTVGLDDEPRARVQTPPSYPFSLKASGVSGEVLVEFIVDERGRVTHPRVVRSTHPDFEASTIAAVSKWRFEPGTRNMTPVSFRMLVPVKFNLNE